MKEILLKINSRDIFVSYEAIEQEPVFEFGGSDEYGNKEILTSVEIEINLIKVEDTTDESNHVELFPDEIFSKLIKDEIYKQLK